jgi:hypothetical protein
VSLSRILAQNRRSVSGSYKVLHSVLQYQLGDPLFCHTTVLYGYRYFRETYCCCGLGFEVFLRRVVLLDLSILSHDTFIQYTIYMRMITASKGFPTRNLSRMTSRMVYLVIPIGSERCRKWIIKWSWVKYQYRPVCHTTVYSRSSLMNSYTRFVPIATSITYAPPLKS